MNLLPKALTLATCNRVFLLSRSIKMPPACPSSSAGKSSERRISHVLSALGAGAAIASMEGAVHTDSNITEALPELMTEYMVDMKCEGCVKSVRSKLEHLEGVKSVDVSLANQIVRVMGTTSVKDLTAALEQTGRNARLIGQGSSQDFATAAAVAEFKGPQIHGVVRIVQVSMELCRIEASFSGLSPGRHGWSINTYGDLTRGAASTGSIFQSTEGEAVGDLGMIVAKEDGKAEFSGMKKNLKVSDLLGRALVVYESEENSKSSGIAAAVVARSAGVGENHKMLCTCDGTLIWESSNQL